MTQSEEQTPVRAHLFVSGHVQGVGFRAFVAYAAKDHALCGWVKNCDDGRVEVEVEGTKAAIQTLLHALQQGPPAARVLRIDVEWSTEVGGFSSFRILA